VGQVIVLLHAPSLGPASWLPVARELSCGGETVIVPSLAGFADGDPPYAPRLVRLAADQVLAQAAGDPDYDDPDVPAQADSGRSSGEPVRSAAGPERVVVVAHSGAGVFVPHVLAAVGPADAVTVLVDAALPGPAGAGPVVDDAFLPYLRELASDGVVPPWPRWWPDEDLAPLFPDDATRRAVSAEAPALPLAFFEETLPAVAPRWCGFPAAYLQFSESYRQPARQAAERGWPTRELPGEHLHILVRPAEVAAAITGLAAG
jgi:hypothetical protein